MVPVSEVKELRLRIRELESLVGRKTMEVEIFRDAVRIVHEKKLVSRVPPLEKDDARRGGLLKRWEYPEHISTRSA